MIPIFMGAPDAGDSAHIPSIFHALTFFWLDGFAVPAPAPVTQTVGTSFKNLKNPLVKKMDQTQLSLTLICITLASPLALFLAARYLEKNQKLAIYFLALAVIIPILSIFIAFLYPQISTLKINNFQFGVLPRQFLSKILTGVGLWLSSISIVGRDRLEKWDSYVRRSLAESKFEKTISELALPIHSFMSWIIKNIFILLSIVVAILIPLTYPGLLSPDIITRYVFPVLMTSVVLLVAVPVLFLLSIALPILPYLLLIPPFWLIILPYKITSRLEQRESLDRAFLLIGLVIGTIGLILS